MKVLISTDLEGISGVDSISDIFDKDTEGYSQARHRLMADTNAAVAACADAGADKIYVVDGHGAGKNFVSGELDSRATQISVLDLDYSIERIDAVVIIGAHAMAGTLHAFLDHTQSSKTIHNYFYNSTPIGELMQTGVFFGHFGTPCVAVSGDRAACAEAKAIFGEEVATAQVKYANERNTAVCIDNAKAERLIYGAVKEGLARREEIAPIKLPIPFEICVEFNTTAQCDEACRNDPRLWRVDGYRASTKKTKIENYFDVLL